MHVQCIFKDNHGVNYRLKERTCAAKCGLSFTPSTHNPHYNYYVSKNSPFELRWSNVDLITGLLSGCIVSKKKDVSMEVALRGAAVGPRTFWKNLRKLLWHTNMNIYSALVDNRMSCFPMKDSLSTDVFERVLFYMYLEISCLWPHFY